MRGLFSQVLGREGTGDPQPPQQQEPDPDTADAMGCFASPKRLGHHGLISYVCVLSYEPTNGLMAVASRGGMVKVFGGPGVELVLEEEGTSIAGEDPPSHLLFPTPNVLIGVTATGALLSWDLAAGGRCGSIPSPLDSATGLEERVTSVHSAAAASPSAVSTTPEAQTDRYVFTGFESGRVRITQVFPVCRASGYTVEPRETSYGAPEELLAPGGDAGKSLGAVTSISSFGDRDGGGVGVFGHRFGGIVIWDWVRRKRLALRSLPLPPSHPEADEQSRRGGVEGEDDRDVTSLAFHPSGEAFAAGFTSGCYAVFSASSSSHDASPPRWVQEVGDDGLCPREGPTIVRSAVSLIQWVSVRGAGAEGAWGLVVAGGVEMEEGEEPDGVSLLVPTSPAPASSDGVGGGGGGGGRLKKKDVVAAAMAALETAVFVPFAIGQERLSHVHCVAPGVEKGATATTAPGRVPGETRPDCTGEAAQGKQDDDAVDVCEELVILGLVKWNEEVRGDDGRLHFRLASSVLACPIQTSPYVALLQLAPEKFGPNVGGFAAVTAVASTPLLSSSTILDFMTCLGDEQAGEGKTGSSALLLLLRGGHLRWPESVPPRERDEALCTSELLVAGHSNGLLTFWECCGPASRQDAVAISEGRVVMREVPSGALLLGSVPVAELAGKEEGAAGVAVTALDVWVERDHVAAAARSACWVAVGFDNGDATVIVLSNRMEAGGSNGGFGSGSGGDGGGRAESGGGTPLAEKPVEVSDVQLRDGTVEDSAGGSSSSSGGGGLLERFVKRGGGQQQPSPGDEETGVEEDAELEAAIAKARADARAIATLEESTAEDPEKSEPLAKGGADGEEEEGDSDSEKQESRDLRQELSEAMAEEGTADNSGMPPLPPRPPPADASEDEETREAAGGKREQPLCLDAPRKASLVQLSLRLHSLSVRCVALSFDTAASALALVVADEGGVVSVTDVSTGSASLLPMRVPQSRPCRPSVAIGPLPGALCGGGGGGGRVPAHGASGALFVLLEGWLNVFDLASRDPVDFAQVPGLAPPDDEGGGGEGGGGGGGTDDTFAMRSRGRAARRDESEEKSWLACVDERGLPLLPYASESFCSSFSPPPAASKGDGGGGGGGGGDGGGCDDGETSGGRGEPNREVLSPAQTIWVAPPPSRSALDDYHEHELQVLNNSAPPEPFLLVVRGAMAVVLAIARRGAENAPSVFSRRSQPSPNAAAFKGRSGAELVVKSRGSLPRAEGHAVPPRVDGAGVCLVPAGKGPEGEVARRGCLVAADSSGFVTGLLLPSLCPIFRDRLPASADIAGGRGGAALAQQSVCNLVGELTHMGMAGELTRWSLLTDEACDTLMGSKARLVKISALARPPAISRQSSGGGGGGGSSVSSASDASTGPPKGRSARGMLGRLSLGGSKKSVTDVFAVEPSPGRQVLARDSSGGGFGSTRSSFSSSAGGGAASTRAAGRREGGDGGAGHGAAASAAAQSKDQREALFGERQAGGGASAFRDGGGVGADGARGGVSETHTAVSEARDLAIERGEKLENLVDRSRQLEDSAMAFGDMAKQLRRQQEEESCCIS